MKLRPKEPFSCYSHLLGAVLAVIALVGLILVSAGDARRIVAFSLYGASLVLLYSASAIYHWLEVTPRKEEWLRRIDHMAIYLLIAGTYTPVCLVTLRGAWGWTLFGIVWGLATVGVVLKLAVPNLPRSLSTALYVAMGWLAVVAVVPLVRAYPLAALLWLLAGGIFYTLGAVVYGVKRPNPLPQVFGFHEIFHVMVLAGSTFHFVFLLRYVAFAASL